MTKPIIAIIFAREENEGFERSSFPILGRPAVVYPVLAATHSKFVSETYFYTSSLRLADIVTRASSAQPLLRKEDHGTLFDEFVAVSSHVRESLNVDPALFVFLLGNSPCVLPEMIDSAIASLSAHEEVDSVLTVAHRPEFSQTLAFKAIDKGFLTPMVPAGIQTESTVFFDARLIVLRPHLLEGLAGSPDLCHLSGKRILPMYQSDGIADIDYPWQVPVAEKWLTSHGFTDEATPYEKSGPASRSPAKVKSISRETKRVLVTTVPFGQVDHKPIEMLNHCDCQWHLNPLGRKLREEDLLELAPDYDILIAGTEPITRRVMEAAPGLKLISRVGIGLDSVDLHAARERGIRVSYTPEAPSAAVSELTMGLMLSLCRGISSTDRNMRDGVWNRIMGRRIQTQVIGIIGTGRIGTRVLQHLQGFRPKQILVNDIQPDMAKYEVFGATLADKETIYREADIITLHIPLTPSTRSLIAAKEIEMMKPSVFLINTSRGGIINEKDLYSALNNERIAGAAIDVFELEPYGGELISSERSLLTCHIGSCSVDCRAKMEIQATEEAIRFIKGEPLESTVPEHEYMIHNS